MRAYTTHDGVVTNNADPRGLGRIKASIPGYILETGWALPFGQAGGEAGLGTFSVPPIGAEVTVSFADGHLDQPRYTGGGWGVRPDGSSGIPSAARDALAESGTDQAHLVHVVETPKFEIVQDARKGKVRLYLRAKSAGENLNGDAIMIELDETNGTIGISAPAAITIRSHGAISIEANQLTLNGRLVASSDKAI